MTSDFKPMLAGKAPEDLSKLAYPVLASPKLDGIRCVKLNGKALSRTLKPIPNHFVRKWVEDNLPDGIDGELMLRTPSSFSEVTSAVMNQKFEPDFAFMAFDLLEPALGSEVAVPFIQRFERLRDWKDANRRRSDRLMIVPHATIHSETVLRVMMDEHVKQGYEGTMVRSLNGRYKFGRSTTSEGILLKIKSFTDETAVVCGCEEEMENTNQATTNEVGRTKRSTSKGGMVGKGRLGALLCETTDGVKFSVGSGFTEAQRIELWLESCAGLTVGGQGLEDINLLVGRLIDFKHQPPPGGRKKGEAPRFPVFLRFRHPEDA